MYTSICICTYIPFCHLLFLWKWIYYQHAANDISSRLVDGISHLLSYQLLAIFMVRLAEWESLSTNGSYLQFYTHRIFHDDSSQVEKTSSWHVDQIWSTGVVVERIVGGSSDWFWFVVACSCYSSPYRRAFFAWLEKEKHENFRAQ